MRLRPQWFVVFAACMLAPSIAAAASASDKAPADAAGNPAGEAAAAGDPMDRVLPEVNFQDVPFDDVVDFLRDVNPGFQAVIVRDPDVPQTEPLIRLRLRQIPMRQVLEVMQSAYPQIQIQAVDSDGTGAAPVYVIKVQGSGDPAAAARAEKTVRVYPLSNEIMTVVRNRGAWQGGGPLDPDVAKKGLEDVLSLLEGVMQAVADRNAPTLAVHEGTQSLIVTGTADQHVMVQETLASLRGERREEQRHVRFEELQRQAREAETANAERVNRLEREVAMAHKQLDELQSRAMQRAEEAERLRIRLETFERGEPRLGSDLRRPDSDLVTGATDTLADGRPRVSDDAADDDHAAVPSADRRTAALTAALAAGDESAVESFYRLWFDTLYHTARRATGRDESFCLDVVQESVLRVIRSARPVESEAAWATWLRLVVRTTAYDLLRAESRRRRREHAAAATMDADVVRPKDEHEADQDERLAWLRERIARLDPGLARAIDLRYARRWTLARVAAALGITIGTLDGRLRRALTRLRRQAPKEWNDPRARASRDGERP